VEVLPHQHCVIMHVPDALLLLPSNKTNVVRALRF
jgi:hypothetical protein